MVIRINLDRWNMEFLFRCNQVLCIWWTGGMLIVYNLFTFFIIFVFRQIGRFELNKNLCINVFLVFTF